jgi:HAE1 family hydrophobic/amphiphilic exporter-1
VNFVIRNKLAVWLLTIIVAASGIYSATRMKMESIPDISIPYLIVLGVYPGATPEQVMEEVSIPIEKAVQGLEDVKTVYSASSANVAQVQIEYDYGVDMLEKKRELEAALDTVTLPEEVGEPTIMTISLNMIPVMALSVSSSTQDIVALTETVENTLLPELEKIDGVASATIYGQHIHEAELTFDYDKMASLGITEDTVKQMIQASHLAVPLGLYEFEEGEQAVTVDGKLASVDELKQLLIPVTPSEAYPMPFITLDEIADIEVVGKVKSIARTNGKDAIAIQIVKGQQANTVSVVNAVKELIKEQEKAIDGLIIDVTLDQGEPIEEAVFAMVEKAVYGGLIAVLIILLFLRDLRSTLISIISIPVSVLIALLVLYWLEITLNIITLGAITIAIGRVIDDSIVVVENIYRRMHLKDEPLRGRALIREATIEMFRPILASTLVTIAVFAPLMFVRGMVGELFVPFALTMSLALLASLAVAITIVPSLSHSLFRKRIYGDKQGQKHKEVGKIALWYKRFLDKCLNHKWITSLVAVALLIGSVALTPLIGFSFLGSQEEKMMLVTYTPKAGELREETLANVEEVERMLLNRGDIETIQLSIANSSPNAADMTSMMFGSRGALMYLLFDDDMPIEAFRKARKEIAAELEAMGHSGTWKEQDFMSMSGFSSNELSYTFFSEDLDDLIAAVRQAEAALADVEGLEDITSDAEDPYVEHVLKVKQANVLQYGLTTAQILMALTGTGSDEVLTTIRHNGSDIEVIVQKEAVSAPRSIEDVLATPIRTALGTTMTIGQLVEVEEGETMNSLTRMKGKYYATVSATIIGNDVSGPSSDAQKRIDALDLPDSVTIDTAGVLADIEETFTQLGIAMVAAVLIVYFILVVTYGEGLAPFAILFSLPFAVIGAFVGLYLTGQTISVMVMMGLLMLIGIVVTNAIVLVDRIVRKEREGVPMREAILESGATRLRPILMTAIATIGAMIPMAVTESGGSLISQDLAITVIGGLFSSTLLTLVVVPMVYEMLTKLFKKNRQWVDET